ncbi:MAG: MarR family transcriptional regulator [Alphaproteobacteria bacterium]|nr:MarR family transcriptional regulator [Alphaproteobacteria bacterium]
MTKSDTEPARPDLVDEVVRRFSRERPDIDPVLLETVSRLIVAGRRMQARGARIVEAMGGHFTDYDVLGMLRTAGPPHELTPAELMELVMISSGAMTACLNRLESAGLVTRRVDESDRRVRRIALTPMGLERADQALTERYADAGRILSTFDAKTLRDLNVVLRAIAGRAASDDA